MCKRVHCTLFDWYGSESCDHLTNVSVISILEELNFHTIRRELWPAAPGLWRIIANEHNTHLQIASEPLPPSLASESIFQGHQGGQEVKVTFGAAMAAIQYRLLRNNVLLDKASSKRTMLFCNRGR